MPMQSQTVTYDRKFRNLEGCKFLVGVGAQRSGTTWLFHYLGRHPDVAMSPIKELHYFDQIFRPDLCGMWPQEFNGRTSNQIHLLASGKTASITDLQFLIDRVRMNSDPFCYLEFFDRLATFGRPVVGEITPTYSLLPERGFAEMRNSIERSGAKMRIVFVMRDPVERFWSQCRFKFDLASSKGSIDEVYENALSDPNFLERTRYDLTITRILNVIAMEDALFLFYENLMSTETSKRLCQFLEIGHVAPNRDDRLNASSQAPLDKSRKQRLRAIFETVYDFVDEKFGDAVPAKWRDAH
jgi:hypothetical protein